MNNYPEILALRASGHVKRWHTCRTLTSQNVAEHSGQAVTLLLMLHPSPSLALIKAMNWHDCAERIVGDAPSPGLRSHLGYKAAYEATEQSVMCADMPSAYDALFSLNDEELRWLKAIDRLEAWLYSNEEMKIGNRDFVVARQRLRHSLIDAPSEVHQFVTWYEGIGGVINFM